MDAYKRNLIKETLSRSENLAKVRQLMAENDGATLAVFTNVVCEFFNFKDYNGDPQISTCDQALVAMDAQGLISLNGSINFKQHDPRESPKKQLPHGCLPTDVPEPVNVPETVEEVEDLRLVLVGSEADRQLWNCVMEKEHPLGAGQPMGYQLFYLVQSKHGLLGAIGFSGASLKLEKRDKFIGWDDSQRKENLDRIVNMSRFLIHKSVHCKNFASKILSLSVTAMREDFHQKYGFTPHLVETFVDQK